MTPAWRRAHLPWPGLFAALALLGAACGGPAAVPPSSTAAATTVAATLAVADAAVAAALQAELDGFVAATSTAGVSAAALWPDGSLWEGAAGFADEPAGRALTPGDTMRIASTTKAFTAAAVLQLVEEGRIGLDDPVAPLLPELGLDGALTVRHLLGHRSGLWNFTLDPGLGSGGRIWEPAEVVALAVEHGPVFPPGSHFAYSNTNFVVAGLVIEALTGRAAETEIRARLLEPLGCAATFMSGYEEGEVTAAPYADPAAGAGQRSLDSSAWTAGALASTPADLVRFGAGLFGGEVLGGEMLQGMTTPQAAAGEGAHYGLGVELFEIGGRPAWGHRGGLPGYLSALFFFPDSGVTLALTADDWRGGDFMGLFARLADLAL